MAVIKKVSDEVRFVRVPTKTEYWYSDLTEQQYNSEKEALEAENIFNQDKIFTVGYFDTILSECKIYKYDKNIHDFTIEDFLKYLIESTTCFKSASQRVLFNGFVKKNKSDVYYVLVYNDDRGYPDFDICVNEEFIFNKIKESLAEVERELDLINRHLKAKIIYEYEG